jgi:hypothetical protein
MKKLINLVAGLVAAALLCVASVSPSCAQTTLYVSGGGTDSNPCTLAAPCLSIHHAQALSGNGGTVICLDAGPYTEPGSSILVSFTLDCRGVVYSSGSNFAFNVQNAVVVTFRHVIFDGSKGGSGAVQIGGGKVVFENCTFQNFTTSPGIGVQFEPSIAGSQLTVTDSVFTNNGTPAQGGGIILEPTAAASVVIERTQVTSNTYGIFAGGIFGTILVEVRYSTIANSVFDGIWANSPSGSVSSIVVEHSASVRNGGNGVNAQGPVAYVSLKDSTVDWNGTGLNTGSGGTILSYQNNTIAGNLHPGVTPVSVSQQ